jgi:hypothetical protein
MPLSTPFRLQVIAIIISSFILVTIFELIRRKRIEEKYGLLWLIMGIILLVFAIKIDILIITANFLGFEVGSNALFLFIIFFLLLIVLSLTVVISDLSSKNRRITQEFAILNKRVEDLGKGLARESKSVKSKN